MLKRAVPFTDHHMDWYKVYDSIGLPSLCRARLPVKVVLSVIFWSSLLQLNHL